MSTFPEPALPLIEEFEGWSSGPYLDTVAVPHIYTAYFGETVGITASSPKLTRKQGEDHLRARLIKDYLPTVDAVIPSANVNRRAAVLSFIYNCGIGAIGSDTKVGRALRASDWSAAESAMLEWCHAGSQVIQGLLNRRRKEVALMNKAAPPAGHADAYYLTAWEAKTVKVLTDQRAIAKRHGGWDKVDASHLRQAARAKDDLRERLKVIASGSQAQRPKRRAALKAAIG